MKKMKNPIYQLFTILFSTVLLGCASPVEQYDSAGDPVPVRGNDCIFQSSIRDYQVLDDKNLIVQAGSRGTYLVELSRRAYGLRNNWSIGFVSPTGRICSGSGEILVDDGFGRKETVRLSSVSKLTSEELDALMVQYGKKEPDHEQAVEPQEIDGAAVEELD